MVTLIQSLKVHEELPSGARCMAVAFTFLHFSKMVYVYSWALVQDFADQLYMCSMGENLSSAFSTKKGLNQSAQLL